MLLSKRNFLIGAGATIIAARAPAIVRAESIMPIKSYPPGVWIPCDGREIDGRRFSGLMRLLGDRYGTEHFAGSFNVPDLRGGAGLPGNWSPLEFEYAIKAEESFLDVGQDRAPLGTIVLRTRRDNQARRYSWLTLKAS